MKTMIIALCTLLLTACAQLTHGTSAGPARVVDAAHSLLIAECNGYANELDVCYQAAIQACPAGYSVKEWKQNYGNISRSITFKCD